MNKHDQDSETQKELTAYLLVGTWRHNTREYEYGP
jgi:hypothetical protein